MKKCLPWQLQTNKIGFSLIELSIVIALIALLVFLTLAHSGFFNRMMVRAELEHLYTVCYYQQRRAVLYNKPHMVQFDLKNGTYTTNERTYHLPSYVRFGTAKGVKGPPSNPHVLITEPITFKEHTITFHADGVIQPGALYLTDVSQNCCYALSCAVAQVSYLRKYQYNNGWHLIE